MYTIENNINTLQDIVVHIYNISGIETMIWNDYCAVIAIRVDDNGDAYLPCFKKPAISKHCFDFLAVVIQAALSEGSFDDRCWCGIRVSVFPCTINGKTFFLMLDRYLLDTDRLNERWNYEKAIYQKENCTGEEVEYARNVYNEAATVSQERAKELLNIMETCLQEFSTRNILDSEVDNNEKLI